MSHGTGITLGREVKWDGDRICRYLTSGSVHAVPRHVPPNNGSQGEPAQAALLTPTFEWPLWKRLTGCFMP